MKKLIIIASFITAIIVTFIASGFMNAFLLFLVVGVIPGTDYSVPAGVMFSAIVGVSWMLLLPFISLKGLLRAATVRLKKPQQVFKKHLPRRRFSQI